MHHSKNRRDAVARRRLLRGGGVAMALPWLASVDTAGADLPAPASASGDLRIDPNAPPRRFIAITMGLGLIPENLYPEGMGADFQSSRYLRHAATLADRMTLVSGSSHPGVGGGHLAEASILSAAPIGSGGGVGNTISVDQLLAKHLGDQTRYPSLVLAAGGITSASHTESGSMITPISSSKKLFADLFIDDQPADRRRHADRVARGRSVLDAVAEDAASLQRRLGPSDRNRLEAYMSSVRQLEQRMQANQRWAELPKPTVQFEGPLDVHDPYDMPGRMKILCDIIVLALQTDSTRFVSLHLPGGGGKIPIAGVHEGYHSLSHHGLNEQKLHQLALVEESMMRNHAALLQSLSEVTTANGSLLDETTVLLTSNLGNASNHSNRNMPVVIAGGGFKHAGHLAFDQNNNYPLANFYVSLLQQSGLAIDTFASGTGTMRGLEPG